jgi:hypothetical protein
MCLKLVPYLFLIILKYQKRTNRLLNYIYHFIFEKLLNACKENKLNEDNSARAEAMTNYFLTVSTVT